MSSSLNTPILVIVQSKLLKYYNHVHPFYQLFYEEPLKNIYLSHISQSITKNNNTTSTVLILMSLMANSFNGCKFIYKYPKKRIGIGIKMDGVDGGNFLLNYLGFYNPVKLLTNEHILQTEIIDWEYDMLVSCFPLIEQLKFLINVSSINTKVYI